MHLFSVATSADEKRRGATVAVLPIGAFEQHGSFLPLTTDTIVACLIAQRVATDHDLLLLPPVTISCSHEHEAFAGTVSISASTLATVIDDIRASLKRSGIERLVLVNAHGGNYVLSNIVQQSNVGGPCMTLFPGRGDWEAARQNAGLVTNNHDDMHAGELEASLLLVVVPDLVGQEFQQADFDASDRRHLLMLGVDGYSPSGVIGRPSLATAEKGRAILDGLAVSFESHLKHLDR